MNLSRRTVFLLVFALASTFGFAPISQPQTMSGDAVIARSIEFHDPDDLWETGSFTFDLMQTQPIGGYTKVDLIIDNAAGKFWMQRDRRGRVTETTITGDECWTKLDGSSDFTEEDAERFRLSCEAMRGSRDYYTYLYGLPMKLRDPGTIIDGDAVRTEFDGDDVWQVRVTYDPEVGTDVWYFYFHPEDFSLAGYRFYHDEAANDGEYIVVDRIHEAGLRLPKVRSWFRNSDDELLGTDKIMGMERISRDG
jgi:hypothetical protein